MSARTGVSNDRFGAFAIFELVTTARQPSTIGATPFRIIGGTTMNGTVAESTYLNGEERGSDCPLSSSKSAATSLTHKRLDTDRRLLALSAFLFRRRYR